MQSCYEGKWLQYGVHAEEIADELLVFDEHSIFHRLLSHIIDGESETKLNGGQIWFSGHLMI